MHRTLTTVTITGADDNTDIAQLKELSAEFPFVEWGLLMSLKRTGLEPEYPSLRWLSEFGKTTCAKSVHLCGSLARNAYSDRLEQHLDMIHCIVGGVDRVQLNMVELNPIEDEWIGWLDSHGTQLILQTKSFADCEHLLSESVTALHDVSGGTGVRATQFDYPLHHNYCGFAGGLTPDNVGDVVKEIVNNGKGEFEFWVDTQSGVRADGKLDLGKVSRFLQACRAYIG